ncbi:NO-inducible flavohemoprotein [Gorillibacterium sp. sgz5001074]|uniref:NO-inducible flavohemoprotein n=1 Tax=Gorillibacterium sp. sgz5001074 TaxID=3446695 RepID=UPI003F6714D3
MPLQKDTIEIIKSTVPILEVHGTAITTRFYQLLFSRHPELLHVFNHANQKQGRQQTALANAVYAAAVHIERLEAILPAVRQIAHKHRSLGVKPEHYPIVGQCLLAAIRDVLQDAASEEILDAWAQAYGVIADAFIGVEAEMYRQAETQPGGWKDFREFRVIRKEQESDSITSFYMAPLDGGPLAPFEAGQYISLKVRIPGEEHTLIRQYSLSDRPGQPYYRISVKREAGTEGKPDGKVSVYLHDHIQEGDRLWISAPAGDFTVNLEDSRPLVLISGGVGLTPMVSMLGAALEAQLERTVTFIHSAVSGDVHAMKAELLRLEREHPALSVRFCYEKPTAADRAEGAFHKEGYLDLHVLQEWIGEPDADFYFCGPVPFMKAVNNALQEWGVPSGSIHYEFFGPAGSLQ